MKQVLFILLVFISFQGFSQTKTIKLNEIGLEVMTEDLGGGMKISWFEASAACERLGRGWRLPTLVELMEKLYPLKDEIGRGNNDSYWSSTPWPVGNDRMMRFNFKKKRWGANFMFSKAYAFAVRDLE